MEFELIEPLEKIKRQVQLVANANMPFINLTLNAKGAIVLLAYFEFMDRFYNNAMRQDTTNGADRRI